MGHLLKRKRHRIAWFSLGLVIPALLGASAAVAGIQGPAVAAGGTTISGTVTEDGAGVAGALVLVRAFPSQAMQEATAPGVQSPAYTLAVTRTSADGTYDVGADLGSVPAQYVNADTGVMNLAVVAMRSGHVQSWAFPAMVSSTTGAAPSWATVTGVAGSYAIPTLDLSSTGYNPTVAKADSLQAPVSGDGVLADTLQQPDIGICNGSHWTSPYGPYQVKVGDATADQIANPSFSYANGGSTSTTLGIAYNGGSGWTASGSVTSSASSTHAFVANDIQTDRMFALWRYHTYVVTDGGAICYQYAEPYDYVGRGQTVSIAHPTLPYCGGRYGPTDIYKATNFKNETYSAGLTVYGVGLSSQAGWQTTNELQFHFTGYGYVCGNTTARESSPRVEADNTYNG